MDTTQLFQSISTFAFDVDGVLTDGTVLVLENAVQARRMSVKDGYALQLAVKKGYNIVVISGAAASPVKDRLNKLGITEVHFGITDKRAFLLQFLEGKGIPASSTLFMGDDVPDLEVMKVVGLAACPSDAAVEIREIAQYQSPFAGGTGCVRDVIEQVLRSRSHWTADTGVASR